MPIYVQEKIHPLALIDDLKSRAVAGKPRQMDLFSELQRPGRSPEEAGVLPARSALEQPPDRRRQPAGDDQPSPRSDAPSKGQVQMIYLDPPYGIKFGSNWQVSTRKRDVKDAKAEDLTRQPEQIKAFRDTWEMGIHSYLTYMRDRLTAARELLTESGSIFVQIGDDNVHLVRSLMDEVFGAENFCGSNRLQEDWSIDGRIVSLRPRPSALVRKKPQGSQVPPTV